MKKIILDVDTGIDDALAILYAAESKKLDILGITGVSGNVPLTSVLKNTKKVLKLLNKQEDIAVYPGAQQPLLRSPHYAFSVHGEDGIGGALQEINVDEQGKQEEQTFAPDFIIEQAKKHKGNLNLIMVGPLTNLALALRKEPRVAQWVDHVTIMGGLVSHAGKGNTLPTSEFNIFADAEAAEVVFHSGAEITLVSLDVTEQTFMTLEHIEVLKGTKYYDFVLESTRDFREFSKKRYGKNGCALHDPLTVGVVIDPSLVKKEKYFLDVETKSELSYGQTICDFKNLREKEPNVNVCLDIEADRFLDTFIKTLKEAS